MSSDIKDFLDQTKVDIEALGGGTAFLRVLIVPAVDIERLMQNPRWPTALMWDGGGTLDPHNHKIWTRILNVTVVTAHPRDTWGEESARQLLDLGETLTAGLEQNTTDSVFLAADQDDEIETTLMGTLIVNKVYRFEYQLERT